MKFKAVVTDVGPAHQHKTQTYELAATLCCNKGLDKREVEKKARDEIVKGFAGSVIYSLQVDKDRNNYSPLIEYRQRLS